MRVLMKVLNEELSVGRCIADFHDDPWVSDIIVMDGGSSDYTVHEAQQIDKVRVFVHPYLDWFHAMEIMQANALLTYVNNGDLCFLIDADERLTDELKQFLTECDKTNELPGGGDLVHVPRRTIEVLRHEDSPFCIYGEDGWPVESHQVGQWPDYQPRLLRRHHEMHWVQSPHRVLMGQKLNHNLEPGGAFILHYEKDDKRRRDSIERRWLRPDATRKELGLANDLYETGVKPEYADAAEPDFWRGK